MTWLEKSFLATCGLTVVVVAFALNLILLAGAVELIRQAVRMLNQ